MYWLGEIYRRGGVQDAQKAIVWYARAAEAGDVRSQELLANMLNDGEGVPAPQPEAAGRYFRLAAYGGSGRAQAELADLLRDRKIPFRPMPDRKPDSGALEIRTLYLAAFTNGNPKAGLALARLYRTGFPAELGSDAIPKDPESAVNLLYKTIERVKQAEPDSWAADPKVAAWAAFELIGLYDKGEFKRRDGSAIISEDQIRLLRQDYGDGSNRGWIRASAIGPISCGSVSFDSTFVMVWDWDRDEPPTEAQLKWLERLNDCSAKEITLAKDKKKKEPKPENIGFTKEFRDRIAEQYRAAREDMKKNGAKAKSFYSRMADLVNSEGGRRRRR
jgi:TPR repeat protein